MESNVKTEQYLNDLLAKTYDAQRGYANAAEVTKNVQLKRWLAGQGAQRTRFAAELTNEIKGMNSTPEFDGTVLGDLHRGWMNIKAALSTNTDETVLEECIRGEKAAVEEYDTVLKHSTELAPSIVQILNNQKTEINQTIGKIKNLEDVASSLD